MEVLEVSQKIEKLIKTLEKGREQLQTRAEAKARTMSEYEKQIAIITMQLKNGRELPFEGEIVKNPPATLIDKIAKGMCFQEKLNMELAIAGYKNAIVGMDSIAAELNGWQSVNRYLDKT